MRIDRRGFLIAGTVSAGLCATNLASADGYQRATPPVKANPEIALPNAVRDIFAGRSHRLHHALWHGLRDEWDNHGRTTEAAKIAIQKLNWNPPRPAARWLSGGWMPETSNGSGVDFLYMHRKMIAEFDREMAKVGADSNVGWEVIPEPGRPSTKHPGIEVPIAWNLPEDLKWLQRRFTAIKSDDFYWSRIRWWDREFHDHAYLRTLSLGRLGSLLETSVHNDMHMRWAAPPVDPEANAILALGRPEESTDPKWDAPAYDFLGETYSSHVNPLFWRLHKWIDGIVDEWFDAHENSAPGEITRVRLDGVNWYASDKWIETNRPWSSPSAHAHHDVETMEKVYHLLYQPSRESSLERSSSPPRNWYT